MSKSEKYIKKQCSPKELLKMHTCGECWVECEFEDDSIELGCETCSNDTLNIDSVQYIPCDD